MLANLPGNIGDVVEAWARRLPDQAALAEGSGTWTYSQLICAIAEAKSYLISRNVRPGDRVMLICENCRAFVAMLLALAKIGAWPVLVNARLSAREVDQIRDHCGARRAMYTVSVSPHARAHAQRHGAAIDKVCMLGPVGVGPLNDHAVPEPLDLDLANNIGVLIYTSGTTGVPKGVMLTHRNLLFVAAISARIRSLGPDARIYGILPMSHAVGLSVALLGSLLSGATVHLEPRFDAAAALAALDRDRLTVVLGVPSMFALLVEYAQKNGMQALKFPALRILSSSGAPLDPVLKAAVEQLFGMPLYNGYGLTECSPNIAQAIVEEPRKDTSVGRVFPGVEVKFVDAKGSPVGGGEVGELWVRGPNVMKGYYHAPEETAAAIDAEGWFNTRDLARLENGNLFIVGRAKEMIVRFAFKVYPAELEAIFNAHPAVVRSAVVGRRVKETEGGEEIVALVQLSPGSRVVVGELADYAARHLTAYKRPSQIIVLPEIPLTPTGKVLKDELAKIAADALRG